jgi:hypothetical protein
MLTWRRVLRLVIPRKSMARKAELVYMDSTHP